MRDYAVMGQQDGELVLYDKNCPKCYGTGQRGRVVKSAKKPSLEGDYIPCRCVIFRKIQPQPAAPDAAPVEKSDA